MEDKIRCQSCGMPLEGATAENLGTEADGSLVPEYCMFCYQNGAFSNPTQTVDEMVQSSIEFMAANLDFEREQASQLSNDVIRKLKRWN